MVIADTVIIVISADHCGGIANFEGNTVILTDCQVPGGGVFCGRSRMGMRCGVSKTGSKPGVLKGLLSAHPRSYGNPDYGFAPGISFPFCPPLYCLVDANRPSLIRSTLNVGRRLGR